MLFWLVCGLVVLAILAYGTWQLFFDRSVFPSPRHSNVMTGHFARQKLTTTTSNTARSPPPREAIPHKEGEKGSPKAHARPSPVKPNSPAHRIERSHYVESFGNDPTASISPIHSDLLTPPKTTTMTWPGSTCHSRTHSGNTTSEPRQRPSSVYSDYPAANPPDYLQQMSPVPSYQVRSPEKPEPRPHVYYLTSPGARLEHHHEGLQKMKKREPVFVETRPVEPIPSPEKLPPPIEEAEQNGPGIDIKASFGNPLTMRITYKDDYIQLALVWPKNDPHWTARIERRLETLSAEAPRAAYLYQDKFYVDRPDWGYRIIISAPPSPGWIPDWKMKERDRAQGEATPIIFPSSPAPTPVAQPPVAATSPPAHATTTPPRLDTSPTTNGSHSGPSQPAAGHPLAFPTTTTFPTPQGPGTVKFGVPPTLLKPAAPMTLPSTGSTFKTPIFPPVPSQSQFAKSPPATQPQTTASPSFTPSTTITTPSRPAVPVQSTPAAAGSLIPSTPKSTSVPHPLPAPTPSEDVGTILQTQLAAPLQSWLPKALTTLPEGSRPDLIVAGPGTSRNAWLEYVRIMDNFKKYQGLMTPDHPEAKKMDDLIRDISNKIGATAASFREKLGDDGLDGALADIQQRNLLGVYYFSLERFAAKVFAEAAMNKVLESESNAIKYGERIVFMLQRHPLLEIFIKWWIFSRCPFAIPLQPQRRPGQDEETFMKKELGFKDVEMDNIGDYLKRTRRYMYLYASILNTAPPGTPNPMGIDHAWRFVARTLALPRTDISLWYLEPIVSICSRRLMYAYGAQWEKITQKILLFTSQPSTGLKFFESVPFISSIRVSIDVPTTHTPIQHLPEHEHLMELKSKYSYKMEFEEGRFATPEQVDVIYMMVDAYSDYLENHVGDVIDDIMLELKHWRELEDRLSDGKLEEKSAAPRANNRQGGHQRGGYQGRGGRGGGRGGGYGRY